ncbi:hypothetical protein [Halobacillus massiliensis]|uniref:hypothetical protein n=1 Tax=Halobacillus massiliensis TaxID=1926286 RepID=UPI0009E1C15D|nr:hypothetical protein [Halobacillus massiliensis]
MSEQYLSQDIDEAIERTNNFWKLTNQMQEQFTQGDMAASKQTAFQMVHIVNELEFLRERKNNQMEFHQLVVQLKDKGILRAQVEWWHED